MADLCKNQNCDYVYPILDTECIGNSLTSINYNFLALDMELCSIENRVTETWGPAYTIFSQNSAAWLGALSVTQANSACWNDTKNTINEMSAFWLKPISIVYPYPFPSSTSINTILEWVQETFPIQGGTCFNYIVGQELYVFSPEYSTINRTAAQAAGVGKKTAYFSYNCDCIGRGSYNGTAYTQVDCGTFSLNVSVPDTFINKFVGIKFVVDSTLTWSGGTQIFG